MPDDTTASETDLGRSKFASVPVDIIVSVGTARPTLKDLMTLEDDGIIPLDKSLDEPVDLYVGEMLIARGELVEIGGEGSGKIGVRITDVLAAAGEI